MELLFVKDIVAYERRIILILFWQKNIYSRSEKKPFVRYCFCSQYNTDCCSLMATVRMWFGLRGPPYLFLVFFLKKAVLAGLKLDLASSNAHNFTVSSPNIKKLHSTDVSQHKLSADTVKITTHFSAAHAALNIYIRWKNSY